MKAILYIFFGLISFSIAAQPGSLNPAFGTNGITTTNIGTYSAIARNDIALQPDGKVVMVGWTKDSPFASFVITRYSSVGFLDPTFDGDGIAYVDDFGSPDDHATSTAVQEDGKILAAGFSSTVSIGDFVIFRLKTNGKLDSTFNGNGKLRLALSTQEARCFTIALQPNGKILMAGSAKLGTYSDFALARINPDGSVDSTFGVGGIVVQSLGNVNSRIHAIALQPDGKIVTVGSINFGGNQDFTLARFNSDGTLDTSFGNQGTIIDPLSNGENAAYAVAIQPDGKILVAGNRYVSAKSAFALVRYCPNGYRDESFGTNGISDPPPFGVKSSAYAMTLQPDNRILIAGTVLGNSYMDSLALAKYNPDGTLNTSFGTGGFVTTKVPNSPSAKIFSILLKPDNSILVGGYASLTTTNTSAHLMLANYFNSLDTTQINSVECAPVAVGEPSLERLDVRVFPNPVEHSATLSYNLQEGDNVSIRLFDLNGRLVRIAVDKEFRKKGVNTETILLEAIPFGCYMLQIRSSDYTANVKIVKQ